MTGGATNITTVDDSPASDRRADVQDISLYRLANALLRHRVLVVATTLTIALAVVAWTLLQPNTYTASASFVPTATPRSTSSRLATQFGVELGGNTSGESPQFYAALLTSRDILAEVVNNSYTVIGEDGSRAQISLQAALEIEAQDTTARMLSAIRTLRAEMLDVSEDPSTGIIEVSVTTPYPALSSGLVSDLLALVEQFNVERRKTQAGAERQFLENRIVEVRGRVEQREQQLKTFLASNRQLLAGGQTSPEFMFEHERLRRQLELQQSLLTSLTQSYEEARLDELRTLPLITIVEQPVVPPKPDPRHLKIRALLGLAIGALLAVALSVIMEAGGHDRSPDSREFTRLWRETVAEAKRLVPGRSKT